MFTTFEAEHKAMFCELPVFKNGVQDYKDLLSFDARRITERLQIDLARIKFLIENWQLQKQVRIAEHFDNFLSTIKLNTLG
jgi:hypothetical protein